MRLNQITTELPASQALGINSHLPLSYLFVESVLSSGVLSEADSNRFGALLKAGLAKLRNFMTPDASTDLDALLNLLVPAGGGLARVKALIQQAKQLPGQLIRNDNWWQELFSVFGV